MSNKDHLDDLSLDADMSEGIKGGVGVPPPPPKPKMSKLDGVLASNGQLPPKPAPVSKKGG